MNVLCQTRLNTASVRLLWISAQGNISSFKRDLYVTMEPVAL